MRIRTVGGLALAATALAGAAAAQTDTTVVDTSTLGTIGVELGKFAIVVVVLESALSALFNWRVWREVFNQKSLKTPILFLTGLMVVTAFNYDVFARVLAEVGGTGINPDGNMGSMIISAMIIAGGSSGINTLFRNLGLRQVLPDAPEQPKLNQTEAWFSVLVNNARPGNAFHVSVAPSTATGKPQLAGTIEPKKWGERLRGAFTAETNRFPNYGGWSVTAGQTYLIEVIDLRAQNAQPKRVFEGSFAPRAIIDFRISM